MILRDENGEVVWEQRFRDRRGRFTGERFYPVFVPDPPAGEPGQPYTEAEWAAINAHHAAWRKAAERE